MAVHIRQRAAKARKGNPFYLDRSSDDPQRRTMCGETPTTRDMSWAACRFAKNMAFVDCDGCKTAHAESYTPPKTRTT